MFPNRRFAPIGLGAEGLGDAPCCPLLVRQGSACD
jgi:hypothetical protein